MREVFRFLRIGVIGVEGKGVIAEKLILKDAFTGIKRLFKTVDKAVKKNGVIEFTEFKGNRNIEAITITFSETVTIAIGERSGINLEVVEIIRLGKGVRIILPSTMGHSGYSV